MVIAVVLAAVGVAYSFVPGRDVQPVGLLDDTTLPDTVIVERFEVQGYTEVTKSYTNISHIEVYVQTADKVVRMGIGGNDTSTNYLTIDESKAQGWVRSNVRIPAFDMAFKGDTESDTAIVVTQRWCY